MREEFMPAFKVRVSLTLLVTQEDIDDIMVGALEGGINYWCSEAEVVGEYLGEYASEQISNGGTLRLHDIETDEIYELTRQKFLNGIKLWFTSGLAGDAIRSDGTIDTCNVDGCAADAIVQLALFGEVVFG